MTMKTRRLMKQTPLISQKGATAVEFAIILPLLILLIFAMIEFGLYMFNRQVITNAAREGARFGVVAREDRRTNSQITQKVRDWSEQNLVTFGGTNTPTVTLKPIDNDTGDGFDPTTNRCVDFDYEFGGNRYRCDLEVQVDFDYNFLFLNTIGIDHLNIQSLATMKME